MTSSVYIGFGSNLGDSRHIFHEAILRLGRLPESAVMEYSRMYETEPVGLTDEGPKFLNAVIHLETDLDPLRLFAETRQIEFLLGKSRSHRSDRSRPIDLDVLLYGDEHIVAEDLEIPHPRMHDRGFVLVPLAEIAPDAWHPVYDCSVASLLDRLPDKELSGIVPRDGSVVTKE